MKNNLRLFLCIAMLLSGATLHAQWFLSGDNHTTGRLSIGTTSYSDKLFIEGAGEWQIRVKDKVGGADWRIGSSGSDWEVGGGKFLISNNSASSNASIVIDPDRKVGIGTSSPVSKLHVSGGAIVASDNNFSNINVRLDGTSIPIIRFSRWTGAPNTFDNAFIGQFYNSNFGEYSLGIGTGHSITDDANANNIVLTIPLNGNVGIGTTSPNEKLTVNGTIYGKEVKVDLSVPGPDYIFANDYSLLPLEELKKYIESNQHLPGVPAATEMEANGIRLGEMNMLLLKKIEELTLYVIELREENKRQDEVIRRLQVNDKK